MMKLSIINVTKHTPQNRASDTIYYACDTTKYHKRCSPINLVWAKVNFLTPTLFLNIKLVWAT